MICAILRHDLGRDLGNMHRAAKWQLDGEARIENFGADSGLTLTNSEWQRVGNGLYAAKSRTMAYGASSPPRLVTVALLAKHRALACEHLDRPRDGLLRSGDGWSTDRQHDAPG